MNSFYIILHREKTGRARRERETERERERARASEREREGVREGGREGDRASAREQARVCTDMHTYRDGCRNFVSPRDAYVEITRSRFLFQIKN